MPIDSCCGCWDLKKGSLAIGIFYLVLMILGVIAAIIMLAASEALIGQPLRDSGLYSTLQVDQWIGFIRGITIGVLIVALLLLLIYALLVRGVLVDSPCLILMWLIFHGIFLVIGTILHIWGVASAAMVGVAVPIVVAVAGLLFDVLQWYWLVVVAKHYQNLRDEDMARKIGRVHPSTVDA